MTRISKAIFLPSTYCKMYVSEIFVYLNICCESCGRVEKSCIVFFNIKLFEFLHYK